MLIYKNYFSKYTNNEIAGRTSFSIHSKKYSISITLNNFWHSKSNKRKIQKILRPAKHLS